MMMMMMIKEIQTNHTLQMLVIIRPIHEMLGAASASVRDLTLTGGYQLKLVGVYRKSRGGMLTSPLRGCRKIRAVLYKN